MNVTEENLKNSPIEEVVSMDEIRKVGLYNVIVHAILQLEGISWEQKNDVSG